MKNLTLLALSLPALAALLLAGCNTTGSKSELPRTTHDGLVLQEDTRAAAVWVQPGAEFGGYESVAILEPEIAFRENWQQDINRTRPPAQPRITENDMQIMIERGRGLLREEFAAELEKAGFTVEKGERVGPDVLLIRPMIVNLDVPAPDPSGLRSAWVRTYTENAISATLVLELFDAGTRQILLRAVDSQAADRALAWSTPRNQATNIRDARRVFNTWASMLVKGLQLSRETAEKE